MSHNLNPNSGPIVGGVRIITESICSTGISTRTIAQSLYAGDRSRTECLEPVGRAFEIQRRDLRQKFRVFPSSRQYQAIPLFDLATEKEKADFLDSGRHWRKRIATDTPAPPREVRISFSYRPTGRVQPLFGCRAREWTITRRDEPGDRKFGENWTQAISDAWYIDFAEVAAHFPGFNGELVHHAFSYAKTREERVVIEHSGERPSGLCGSLETKTLRHTPFNGEMREDLDISSRRIISIREEEFPSSMFEVPQGFRDMPVYPSRFTIARLNCGRVLTRLWQSL